MRCRRSAVVVALLFTANSFLPQISASPQAQQNASAPSGSGKRSITEKDLFKFTWIANPQLSPDGTRVAFTRVVVDEKRAGYETSIWTVATAGNEPPVRMTNGKHDTNPRWSRDGRHIAFVRGGEIRVCERRQRRDVLKQVERRLARLDFVTGPRGISLPVRVPCAREIGPGRYDLIRELL